jgi:hypothetical protein
MLRNEAYAADRLEGQLADQTKRFLADPVRGLRIDDGELWVSKIFRWYGDDFTPGRKLTAAALIPVLEPYLEPAVREAAAAPERLKVYFLDYDWMLNDQG